MRVYHYSFTLLAIILSACFAISAQAQCKAGEVVIPIIYGFSGDEYKVAEIYNSLQPRLRMPNTWPITPSGRQIQNGALELQFCVSAKDIPHEGADFWTYFGPREMKLTVRPINTQNQRMSVVRILDQPNPDWVIIRYAKLVLDKNLYPILEVGTRNLSGTTHSGFELEIDLRQRILCIGGDVNSGDIPINFSFQAGKEGEGSVIVTSRDRQFSRAVRRVGKYSLRCGEVSFLQAALGATGAMSASEDLTLQYTFDQKYTRGKKAVRNITKPTVADFLHFEGKKLIVRGERVFPLEVTIEDKMH
jgi:hypothetical protein